MSRRATLVWIALLGAASAALYQLKYEVLALEAERAALTRTLRAEQEAVQVLEAEWAYLNRPERLAELARRHLADLAPVVAGELADLRALPVRGAAASGNAEPR